MTDKLMICPKKECWQRFCDHVIEHEQEMGCHNIEIKPEPDCPACIEYVEVKDAKESSN
jgi:hypothetical protein